MKLALGLVVTMGLFGIGCGDDPAPDAAPPEPEVTRVASSLERKLMLPIAVPTDTPIGQSIDTLLEAQTTLVARDPVVNLGANGKRCTIVRYDDENGAEVMLREKCEGAADTLTAGNLVYTDENSDGKIDHYADNGPATYELFDDNRDGKLDRMVESAARIKTPIALSDFAQSVTITNGGKIASRERADMNHDGKFDLESVTATTSFRISQAH